MCDTSLLRRLRDHGWADSAKGARLQAKHIDRLRMGMLTYDSPKFVRLHLLLFATGIMICTVLLCMSAVRRCVGSSGRELIPQIVVEQDICVDEAAGSPFVQKGRRSCSSASTWRKTVDLHSGRNGCREASRSAWVKTLLALLRHHDCRCSAAPTPLWTQALEEKETVRFS